MKTTTDNDIDRSYEAERQAYEDAIAEEKLWRWEEMTPEEDRGYKDENDT